jgi:hypothetical protein
MTNPATKSSLLLMARPPFYFDVQTILKSCNRNIDFARMKNFSPHEAGLPIFCIPPFFRTVGEEQ